MTAWVPWILVLLPQNSAKMHFFWGLNYTIKKNQVKIAENQNLELSYTYHLENLQTHTCMVCKIPSCLQLLINRIMAELGKWGISIS